MTTHQTRRVSDHSPTHLRGGFDILFFLKSATKWIDVPNVLEQVLLPFHDDPNNTPGMLLPSILFKFPTFPDVECFDVQATMVCEYHGK